MKAQSVQEIPRALGYGEIVQFLGAEPPGVQGVIGRLQPAANIVGLEVYDHVVEAEYSLFISLYQIKGVDWLFCFDR